VLLSCPWRSALHGRTSTDVIASADGYEPVTTHAFDADNEYLDSDAVFGVKDSLVRVFTRHEPGAGGLRPPHAPEAPYSTATCDIVLSPRPAAAAGGPPGVSA
jgi:hydroxyquinol 1,2-dioxygenase